MLLTACIGVAAAAALQLRAGDILIEADGGFSPRALPRDHDAPITVHGGGRISTVSGALPPVLRTITLEFDRHGSLQTLGLPVCTMARLASTTTRGARQLCPGAVVGTGFGKALVKLPEQGPFPASSPITLFNGPRKNGSPTILAHAYLTQPVPATFVVLIVIERIHRGIYGYRTRTRIPSIANGYGIPVSGRLWIGRKWTYRGRRHSYLNARCETGRLQAHGEFSFVDGTRLHGTFLRACTVR